MVTFELLDLYKELPQCKDKPNFVDAEYYASRKKATKAIQCKEDFKREGEGRARARRDHGHHHREGRNLYCDFERGTNKQQITIPLMDEDTKCLRKQAQ